MTHTDTRIYDDSLYLIECIIMRRIDVFISKYASRDDSSDRRSIVSHDEILHARCLGREDIACSFEPEGILHIASGVIFRDIHRIEVQILGRDFHRLVHIESHTTESIFDLLTDYRDRVEASLLTGEWESRIFPLSG